MRLLILGTGRMAESHAQGFKAIEGVALAACVDVRKDAAEAFADSHGIAKTYTSLDAAISDGGFDAVANVTPDSAHYATTMTALRAGLHVFCEKPLATTASHAM
ncbi:MAG: Gfo/Idh/MocA family oxidoreductase, partial [Pseudomonadota bacterium]